MPLHDLTDKKDSYENGRCPVKNSMSMKKKKLIRGAIWCGLEKNGGKIGRKVLYVIENKCSKNVRLSPLQDVAQNKILTTGPP